MFDETICINRNKNTQVKSGRKKTQGEKRSLNRITVPSRVPDNNQSSKRGVCQLEVAPVYILLLVSGTSMNT